MSGDKQNAMPGDPDEGAAKAAAERDEGSVSGAPRRRLGRKPANPEPSQQQAATGLEQPRDPNEANTTDTNAGAEPGPDPDDQHAVALAQLASGQSPLLMANPPEGDGERGGLSPAQYDDDGWGDTPAQARGK